MSDMHSMLPPLNWQAFLHQWELRPAWDAAIVIMLLAYVAGLVSARRKGVRAVHPMRVVSFTAGLVVLAWSLNSAVEVYRTVLMWDHMIQHLLLIMVVPALLVMGSPLTVLLAATSGRTHEVAERILGSTPVAVITHPLVGLSIYSAVIVGTHLTSFMDQIMRHVWLGSAEQLLYLLAGYLFLLPLLGSEPIRGRLPHLFRIALFLIAMTPDTIVGIVLLQTDHDMFPVMEGGNPAWAPDPVHDLHIAGGLMWALGDGLMMVFAVAIVIALIAHPTQDAIVGTWLENVRRQTLSDHVDRGSPEAGSIGSDDDVDESETVLASYNRMLGRLNQHGDG